MDSSYKKQSGAERTFISLEFFSAKNHILRVHTADISRKHGERISHPMGPNYIHPSHHSSPFIPENAPVCCKRSHMPYIRINLSFLFWFFPCAFHRESSGILFLPYHTIITPAIPASEPLVLLHIQFGQRRFKASHPV